MTFNVFLTDDAARDVGELITYVEDQDSVQSAQRILNGFEKLFRSLSHLPSKGEYPKELLELGIKVYRQAHFKPYRVIYRIEGPNVYVLVVADGRRDMHALLLRRLLKT
jgi:toxin ParE1/3/4